MTSTNTTPTPEDQNPVMKAVVGGSAVDIIKAMQVMTVIGEMPKVMDDQSKGIGLPVQGSVGRGDWRRDPDGGASDVS